MQLLCLPQHGQVATQAATAGHAPAAGLSAQLVVQDPAAFAQYGVRVPRGVLLWGPPGTGKSGLAVAAAADARASLLLLQGPDILSQYAGDAEASVQVLPRRVPLEMPLCKLLQAVCPCTAGLR